MLSIPEVIEENGERLEIMFNRHAKRKRCAERDIGHDEVREAIKKGIPILVTAWKDKRIGNVQQSVILQRKSDGLNVVGNFETDGMNHSFAVLTVHRKRFFEPNGTPVFYIR